MGSVSGYAWALFGDYRALLCHAEDVSRIGDLVRFAIIT